MTLMSPQQVGEFLPCPKGYVGVHQEHMFGEGKIVFHNCSVHWLEKQCYHLKKFASELIY